MENHKTPCTWDFMYIDLENARQPDVNAVGVEPNRLSLAPPRIVKVALWVMINPWRRFIAEGIGDNHGDHSWFPRNWRRLTRLIDAQTAGCRRIVVANAPRASHAPDSSFMPSREACMTCARRSVWQIYWSFPARQASALMKRRLILRTTNQEVGTAGLRERGPKKQK